MTFTYSVHKDKQKALGCHPLIMTSERVKDIAEMASTLHPLCPTTGPQCPCHPAIKIDLPPFWLGVPKALQYRSVLTSLSLLVIGTKRDTGHKLDWRGGWGVDGWMDGGMERKKRGITERRFTVWFFLFFHTAAPAIATAGGIVFRLSVRPSICPILVNVIFQEHMDRKSSNVAQTFTRSQG